MKQPLIILLFTSFLFPAYVKHDLKNKPLKGYWRRVHATDAQKQTTLDRIKKHEDKKQAHEKDKQDYLAKIALAQEIDKKQYLENKQNIWQHGLKEETAPYSLIAHFDSTYYHGINLELLNGSSQCDAYSFMQYIFDTGLYVHPHLHTLENETLEFKAITRMKGVAGDSGKYMQTEPTRTKIGWSVTEYKTSTSFNRFTLWMRELWLKYYFNEDKTSFITTGLFPYAIGHGISLGNGQPESTGQPFPGQYTFEQIDQFRPGLLARGTFSNDQAYWDLYVSFGTNYSTTFQRTAELSDAQNTARLLNVSRGTDKQDYIIAAQVKAYINTKNPDTECIFNPYFVLSYDNTQHVEFEDDAKSRLYTFGGCFEWESGPLSMSIEGAQNLGHQQLKAWDRNELNFAAVTWNSHILLYDPNIQGLNEYPATIVTPNALIEKRYTHAIGVPPSATATSSPLSNYSRQFSNGELFSSAQGAGITPTNLIYKNSNSRFRKAYKNHYRGWFVMGDLGYQFRQWRFGMSSGIFSGDESPNDSQDYILATRRFASDSDGTAFVYKDTNKNYKGFMGVNELFKSKSIAPCFIHEAQKLNCPLVKCANLTTPQITNLLFLGFGLKNHRVYDHKEWLSDLNFIIYSQKADTHKSTNMPYTEFLDLQYSTARQTDSKKRLDTYLGFECNASLRYNITHDLNVSGQLAVFVPGKYYNTADGKYLPFDKQANLVIADHSGIFTVPEQFDITLGKDTAFFATIGMAYSFDSLFLKNTQNAYKPYKKIKR